MTPPFLLQFRIMLSSDTNAGPIRPGRRQSPHRRGVTTVEMAMIAAVLFLFIFGGFEVTRLVSLKQTAEYASYAGARAGIISGATAAEAEAMAAAHLRAVGVRDADIVVEPAVIDEATDIVKVRVGIPMSSNSWGVPQFFAATLSGQSSLLTERAATVMNETVQNLPTTPPPGTPTNPPPTNPEPPTNPQPPSPPSPPQPPTQPSDPPGGPGGGGGPGDGPSVPPVGGNGPGSPDPPSPGTPSTPPTPPPPPPPPLPPPPPPPPRPPAPPSPPPPPPPPPTPASYGV